MLTALPSLIIQGLTTMGAAEAKSEKMKALGMKGVEARQVKAEEQAMIALASADDPVKGILAEMVPLLVGAVDMPAYIRKGVEAQVRKAIVNTPINITNAAAPPVIKWLDTQVTKLSGGKVHLAEELKALGVLSTAEKVAE